MRQKFADVGSNVQQGSDVDKSQGAARAISSFIDPGLSWRDLDWFKSITKMPIILKVRSLYIVQERTPALTLLLLALRASNAGKMQFWQPRPVVPVSCCRTMVGVSL